MSNPTLLGWVVVGLGFWQYYLQAKKIKEKNLSILGFFCQLSRYYTRQELSSTVQDNAILYKDKTQGIIQEYNCVLCKAMFDCIKIQHKALYKTRTAYCDS